METQTCLQHVWIHTDPPKKHRGKEISGQICALIQKLVHLGIWRALKRNNTCEFILSNFCFHLYRWTKVLCPLLEQTERQPLRVRGIQIPRSQMQQTHCCISVEFLHACVSGFRPGRPVRALCAIQEGRCRLRQVALCAEDQWHHAVWAGHLWEC